MSNGRVKGSEHPPARPHAEPLDDIILGEDDVSPEPSQREAPLEARDSRAPRDLPPESRDSRAPRRTRGRHVARRCPQERAPEAPAHPGRRDRASGRARGERGLAAPDQAAYGVRSRNRP